MDSNNEHDKQIAELLYKREHCNHDWKYCFAYKGNEETRKCSLCGQEQAIIKKWANI